MRVTVVVPVRDYADLVGGCIASVLASKYDGGLRVAVVDDGSQDGSPSAIAGAIAGAEVPVEVFRVDVPVGPAAARNIAIRAAWDHSDAFAFLDADDACHPWWLRLCVERLKAGAGLAYADEDVEDRVAGTTRLRLREPYSLSRLKAANIVGGNFVVTREALGAAGLLDESFPVAEMHDLARRIGEVAPGSHVPVTLVTTRLTARSLRRRVHPSVWEQHTARARRVA